MEVDYRAWAFWLDVMQWLFTLSVMIFVWIDRGRTDNKALIKEIQREQATLSNRLLSTEEKLRHAPTHEDIATLREQYSGLNTQVARAVVTLDRIHDYLMNNKGA